MVMHGDCVGETHLSDSKVKILQRLLPNFFFAFSLCATNFLMQKL